MLNVDSNILKDIFKKRHASCKKYDFGMLLVIGGSQYYSGSPALSAMAAFRTGVDMVRVLAPKRAANIIDSFSPNLAAFALPEEMLTKKHISTLLSFSQAAEEVSDGRAAVVIGGGLGRSDQVKEVCLEYLRQTNLRAVIDADAIHAVAQDTSILKNKNFVLTPHSFEFSVLTGREISDLTYKEKLEAVKREASRLKTTILLTGEKDLIASEDGETAINNTGSPYMTVGGTGDSLAGITGALLARKIEPFQAASAAAYLNGRAGERAAGRLGPSLLATDVIDAIPKVLVER